MASPSRPAANEATIAPWVVLMAIMKLRPAQAIALAGLSNDGLTVEACRG